MVESEAQDMTLIIKTCLARCLKNIEITYLDCQRRAETFFGGKINSILIKFSPFSSVLYIVHEFIIEAQGKVGFFEKMTNLQAIPMPKSERGRRLSSGQEETLVEAGAEAQ